MNYQLHLAVLNERESNRQKEGESERDTDNVETDHRHENHFVPFKLVFFLFSCFEHIIRLSTVS